MTTAPDPVSAGSSSASASIAGGLPAAPLLRRMAALLYESVLLFGILFATGLIYAIAVRQTNGMQHRTGLIAVCFLVLGLYFIGLWTRGGQTLAMKTWHLRVVTRAGEPLTPRRALTRYVTSWVWFLPPLLLTHALALPNAAAYFGVVAVWIVLYALSALAHPRGQFWHDALCDTAVVTALPLAPLPQ